MNTCTVAIVMPISVIPGCSLQHKHPKQPLVLPGAALRHVKMQGISCRGNCKQPQKPAMPDTVLGHQSGLFKHLTFPTSAWTFSLKSKAFVNIFSYVCAVSWDFIFHWLIGYLFFRVSPCWKKASAVGATHWVSSVPQRGLSLHHHAQKGNWQSLRLKKRMRQDQTDRWYQNCSYARSYSFPLCYCHWVVCPLRKFST